MTGVQTCALPIFPRPKKFAQSTTKLAVVAQANLLAVAGTNFDDLGVTTKRPILSTSLVTAAASCLTFAVSAAKTMAVELEISIAVLSATTVK